MDFRKAVELGDLRVLADAVGEVSGAVGGFFLQVEFPDDGSDLSADVGDPGCGLGFCELAVRVAFGEVFREDLVDVS